MKLDPQAVIRAAGKKGIVFTHVDKGTIQEWRGLLTTCEEWCTWYSGFSIIEGVDSYAVMVSSVLDPTKMVTFAYIPYEDRDRIVKIIYNQLTSDHVKKGCRKYKTK